MRRNHIMRMVKAVEANRGLFGWLVLAAIVSVMASLAGPWLIGKSVDAMVGKGRVDFGTIFKILSLLAGLYTIGNLFGWLLAYLSNRVAYLTVNNLRQQLFDKLNSLPLRFFDSNPHGDTIDRFINDLDTISDGITQGLATLLTGLVTVVGAVGLMLSLSPMLTLVVLLAAPVSLLVARFITKRSQRLFKEQAKDMGDLNGYIEEMISGQKVVQAFNFEQRSLEQFQEINQKLYQSGVQSQFYGSLAGPTTRLVNNIAYSAIGLIGSIAAILGKVTVGDISGFLIYATLFAKPFNDITAVLTQIQAAAAATRRIVEILDLTPETPDRPEALQINPQQGQIGFHHVHFAYQSNQSLIANFNLQIEPGSRVAIVGPTGAGKTTLVNLVMRFYEVDQGAITIDGVNISRISRDNLRRSFGMVLQDTWLFAGSIRDNIAYGRPEASDAAIIAAAKAADAHGFIRRLPQGYDTLITDAGENLSQGQKQLLTIARVMLVDPPMLILDEATSNIDTRTELRIQQAFLKMVTGRTSFIIAHRLSTIREADLILVMDQGNIVESGTHEQLLAQDGPYCQLYRSQFAPV